MTEKDHDHLGESLDLLQDTYNYNHWIYSMLRPWLHGRLLEVGAGVGNLTQFFLGLSEVVCLEPDAHYAASLEKIVSPHTNVSVIQKDLAAYGDQARAAGELFDCIVSTNVLEHIEDDRAALAAQFELLNPGGSLLLYVPATPFAYGSLDKAFGHFRRYGRRDLRRKLTDTGFRIDSSRYVNLVGLAGWFWAGRIKRDTDINLNAARTMDSLVPHVAAIERLIKPFIGQSLFFVATKAGR